MNIDKKATKEYTVFTKGAAYEWDPNKNAQNQQKHGVSFEEAITVFEDDRALLIADLNHSAEEERFIVIGLSGAARILYVCHCYRDEENTIRIISARRATEKETEFYAERSFDQ